jgi:hypothetical protein
MTGVWIEYIDPTGFGIDDGVVRALEFDPTNLFGLCSDLVFAWVGKGNDSMMIRIVGIIQVVPRVIDYGVVALYRKGRYRERLLGAITIKKAVGGACSDDLRTSRSKCNMGKAPKCETLVDGVVGGNF